MSNITLNAGGFIGALLAGGVAAAVIFTQFDLSESGRGAGKLILLAIAGGAAAGNFLWARFAKKPDENSSDG
jgi:hypothetical protein